VYQWASHGLIFSRATTSPNRRERPRAREDFSQKENRRSANLRLGARALFFFAYYGGSNRLSAP
jgi:hypothetical protein